MDAGAQAGLNDEARLEGDALSRSTVGSLIRPESPASITSWSTQRKVFFNGSIKDYIRVVCKLWAIPRRPKFFQDLPPLSYVEPWRRVKMCLLEVSYLYYLPFPGSDVPAPSPASAAYSAVGSPVP